MFSNECADSRQIDQSGLLFPQPAFEAGELRLQPTYMLALRTCEPFGLRCCLQTLAPIRCRQSLEIADARDDPLKMRQFFLQLAIAHALALLVH